jgi:hypothetical protein
LNHRNKGIHTGSTALGSGDTKPLSSPNADAAVQAENELLEAEEHLPWLLAGTDKGSRRVEPETLLSSRKGSPIFLLTMPRIIIRGDRRGECHVA